MFKKAQMSLEMIMLYGFIILAVIAAIAVFSWLGFTNPWSIVPSKCDFPAGIGCVSHKLEASGAWTVIVRNGLGQDLTNVDLNLGTSNGICVPTSLINGADATCTGTTTAGTVNQRLKETLALTYRDEGGLTQTVRGVLATKYQ